MNRLCLFIALFVVSFSAFAEGAQAPAAFYVEIQQTKLRSEAKHFSEPLTELRYGDKLQLLDDQGDWKLVNFRGQKGFVHESAVTKKVVVLREKGVPVPTDVGGGEIVLAGKGFNPDIEKKYGEVNTELNYKAVDRLESVRVGGEAMLSFIDAIK
jgi:hypothetical protein